ncbi:MAG: hypothetical protein HY913_10875 [Desulfomonile tiedjei]|nr:hypothetical protein [Desulfomonile tiedjei]
MRIRKLKIFTVFFVILVVIAVYGLALLRTYVFKPPPSSSAAPPATVATATLGCSPEVFRDEGMACSGNKTT